jgi:hypothetical protein
MIYADIIVCKIRYRLKRNRTIAALVDSATLDYTYSAIVNLLYMIAARHVSRKLLTLSRRLGQDSHAWMIVLLVHLHSNGVDVVLPSSSALSQDLIS